MSDGSKIKEALKITGSAIALIFMGAIALVFIGIVYIISAAFFGYIGGAVATILVVLFLYGLYTIFEDGKR